MSLKIELIGRPAIVKEFDGLRTITRQWKIVGVGLTVTDVETSCFKAFATADAEYVSALLTKQYVQAVGNDHNADQGLLVMVFTEFVPGTMVNVGNDVVSRLPDARESVAQTSVCLASEAEALAPAVGAVFGGKAVQQVQIQKQGVGAQVVVTLISAGKLAESTRTSNNGALVVKSLTYFNQVPPTPAGYILITEQKTETEGLITYTYTFAKGNGVISSTVSTSKNGARVDYRITKITPADNPVAPTTPAATIAGVVVLTDNEIREEDGYKVYSYHWVEANGIVSSTVNLSNKGKRVDYRVVKYTPASAPVAPTAPAATIGGTVVLVDNDISEEDGFKVYAYRWAEGNGIISDSIDGGEDGLRTETWVSLGTKQSPPGVPTRDDFVLEDGVTRYTVTCRQSATGGDPTSTVTSFKRQYPFTYPGRAVAYKRTVAGSGLVLGDVYLNPPVETDVDATLTVSYSTDPTLTVLNRFQPLEWATLQAQYLGRGGKPVDRIQALRGYRSVSAAAVTVSAPVVLSPANPGGTIFGDFVYGGTTGTMWVRGGPVAPDLNTYTLHSQVDVAFTSVAGVVYYRKTVIEATIPAQPALPSL